MGSNKEKIEEKIAQLIRLTKEFNHQYLNEEYDSVIDKLIKKMVAKKEVPFVTGRIEIWASAVIHALGTVNFLFDKSSDPYVSVADICQFFNTKQSTTTQKSKKIRDMFNMSYFDSEFSIETIDKHNPLHNLTTINGLLVPKNIGEEQGNIEVEEWELKVAQVLGVKELKKDKKVNGSNLYELLEVTDERLMMFYDYLQRHLTFPFMASFEEEIGFFEFVEYDIKCFRLDQKVKVDEFYGILLECRLGRTKEILPLADIEVDEDNVNNELFALYQNWFWTYR